LLSGGVLFFVFLREYCRVRVKRLIIFLEGRLPKFLVFLLHKFREAANALGSLRSRSRLGSFFLLSCFVWASDLLSVWSAFAAGGIYLRPLEAVFMAAFPVFATLIPFQTPLGLGTFEATIASGLFVLGVPVASALRASVFLHAQFLLFSVIAFLASHRIRKSGASVIS
ncbi:MAG: lysylphosphatidylglycerol synthase domain-containing protein, partial [Patescibacteria group bacterium]